MQRHLDETRAADGVLDHAQLSLRRTQKRPLAGTNVRGIDGQRHASSAVNRRVFEVRDELNAVIGNIEAEGMAALAPMPAKADQVSILYLDPSVQHVGISRLRALNVTPPRELDKTLVIQDNDKPLAVLLKYEHFLVMQEKILKCEEQ